ncbi:hypothetical protein CFIMG_003822RA [Ceratocystis fimbriata CBS 114723]|uniref:RAD50-interacting protein 1 n=1 Tax=Ceratocystis fimbriata CBS 114723 TaxID=1035309 RepID=A0A2C5X4H9_9PEZI|nr:hypothetical protein CFIMG_003822RA [Ceratocystis fimbriata CBS 114723]
MAEMTPVDMRIADYLDDKLQTLDDFSSLDELLASVEDQRDQLQRQLDSTINELDYARSAQDVEEASLNERIAEFQQLQKKIDESVATASTAAAPTEAIQRLQEPLRKIQTVELAQSYLELLQDAHDLKTQALKKVVESPKAAIVPYGQLKGLADNMRKLHSAADEAAVHLVGYIETLATDLWAELKTATATQLETILAARKWPMVDPESEMDDEWILCVDKVLELQSSEILSAKHSVSLLPFDIMCKVFISEFEYHFMSDKPTSAAQSATTHCFPWFLATIEKWEDFFRDNLGYLMALKVKNTPVANNLVYVDPVCAFITTMLPAMQRKAELVLKEISGNGALLSRFIIALMDFDDSIRAKFNYDDGSPDGWAGLTTTILDKWFDPWFMAERKFAMERLQSIMEAPDSKTIDYDYGGAGKTKPTKGAVKVTDLLKSVTMQYQRVRKFKHRLKFLINIQLDIMDEYHDYLSNSLQAYQAMTSTVGRTLHGLTKEQAAALEGTGGMESLCKVYGSSDHIITTLKDWSNEEFFVALWYELHGRTKKNDHKRVTSGVSVEQVKDRISTAVDSETREGVLFDETIMAYTHRKKLAHELLVGAIVESHNKALRLYTGRLQWTTLLEDTADISSLSITPELETTLSTITRNLEFLSKILGSAPLRRTWRDALDKLQFSLWSDVLTRQNFTAYGAAQFARDVEAVCSVIERYIPGASSSINSLAEGSRLLNLPIESSEENPLTLKKVTDMVFTDNTEAKKVLSELGMENLSPVNARNILERRVETQD